MIPIIVFDFLLAYVLIQFQLFRNVGVL